ncbi:SigE family RNA polymerase sigma factor [Luteipulveratus sp. YIM 133132]|uniref:SigE family RNA polymerase sigma factor n=1 Tax=Luteipulveratus flavus TaxID=3031728 RepID=A0ABT6C7B3_9MICO|nr:MULTISPECIES: SigE family RNA polymerase sigma factor [unclassified Luteipulveratus]MDE9365732.1 SigE family RNA polymerase sigma factor [Luteipulveratus sp. YIM 133132]MDF8264829.1 SigE family RNA polymerase sigma factor [Luteipulveratus sp. YIM 133296]
MRASDEATFVGFVTSASPGLLRTAWLLTGDHHLAEELVQESLERLYPKWRRVQHQQPLAYTRRILVNLNISRWRRSGAESVSATGVLRDVAAPDALGVADQRDEATRLLRTLPPRERQVVVLRYYADLPEREVADLLGISVGTVKSTASHGLATLRAALAAQEQS